MAKIDTGSYLVRGYDKYGTPQRDFDANRSTLTDADGYGLSLLESYPEIRSYTVDRRVRNSLDETERF